MITSVVLKEWGGAVKFGDFFERSFFVVIIVEMEHPALGRYIDFGTRKFFIKLFSDNDSLLAEFKREENQPIIINMALNKYDEAVLENKRVIAQKSADYIRDDATTQLNEATNFLDALVPHFLPETIERGEEFIEREGHAPETVRKVKQILSDARQIHAQRARRGAAAEASAARALSAVAEAESDKATAAARAAAAENAAKLGFCARVGSHVNAKIKNYCAISGGRRRTRQKKQRRQKKRKSTRRQ